MQYCVPDVRQLTERSSGRLTNETAVAWAAQTTVQVVLLNLNCTPMTILIAIHTQETLGYYKTADWYQHDLTYNRNLVTDQVS